MISIIKRLFLTFVYFVFFHSHEILVILKEEREHKQKIRVVVEEKLRSANLINSLSMMHNKNTFAIYSNMKTFSSVVN